MRNTFYKTASYGFGGGATFGQGFGINAVAEKIINAP